MKINASMPVDANYKLIPNGDLVGTVLATTYDATISSATSITLQAGTTGIIVSAIDKGIFLRFQAGASSTAFDGFIPANTTVVFARPEDCTVISVIEEAATAKVVVIEK
jgi:hypothetical protein